MSKQSKAGVGPLARAVAAEVRAEMARQEMTGIELSRVTGLSNNYLARRLRGEFPFTLNDLEPVASALRVSPAELFSRGMDASRRAAMDADDDEK